VPLFQIGKFDSTNDGHAVNLLSILACRNDEENLKKGAEHTSESRVDTGTDVLAMS
jgi:hypothetical protein